MTSTPRHWWTVGVCRTVFRIDIVDEQSHQAIELGRINQYTNDKKAAAKSCLVYMLAGIPSSSES